MSPDHQTVERFAENLKARGKQPATIESYCRDAQRFLDYIGRYRLQPAQLEPSTLIAYQDFLRSDLSERDNSVRRTVIGIRQFFRFLTESQAIQSTPFDSVPIPMRDETLPRGLKHEDVSLLIATALGGRPECKAARDAAMVALLAFEGVKANELIQLRWLDLFNENGRGRLHIGGSRARSLQLSDTSLELLESYRSHYRQLKHPALTEASPSERRMFISFKGRDAGALLPMMTRHGLKFILYELGAKASPSQDKLNTEQLRHFAVSYLIGLGRAPDAIMAHLGLRRLGNIAKHLAARPS